MACLCGSAYAQVWAEVGEATDVLPGQLTIGAGPLTTITGSILTSGDGDLFEIRITSFASFSASTNNAFGTLVDTQLFLFDSSGIGVAHNDDDPGGGGSFRSALSSAFLTANGTYLLGISSFDNDPLNGAGLAIWADTPYGVERAPDGPGAPGPLVSWDNGASGSGTYQIDFTGTAFGVVPEPASMIALGLGVAALLARRRRKLA